MILALRYNMVQYITVQISSVTHVHNTPYFAPELSVLRLALRQV